MKKTFLLLILFVMTLGTQAQELHTKWTQTIKKINANEYDLILTAKIDPGWHIYSMVKSIGDGAPNPTTITFKKSAEYEVVGATKESKPIEENDKMYDMKTSYFVGKAVFTTRIKLKTPGAISIKGTYEYQLCTDRACTFPPYEDFTFNIPAKKG
ncbi:MAG: hypothetical protein IAF38_14130, partial [Bacteroidia bacterium]|nr:hypothetical protein [Bacteroidia bacterium]